MGSPMLKHYINGNSMHPPFPQGMEKALFGMGCFWGPERRFWQQDGVHVTAVGYAGGYTVTPNYQDVCSGETGHVEVVLVVYDPGVIDYPTLLKHFWQGHDPTQGMRQGNDRGSQYRSALYTFGEQQHALALSSRDQYQSSLSASGYGEITTEIKDAPQFYYAEEYHQQYLAKNPGGYCGMGGTGVVLKES